nr:MAG TPA: hypothetical protein [Caudoviricetes sp.]
MLDNQGSSPESYRSTASNDATSLTFTLVSSRIPATTSSLRKSCSRDIFCPQKSNSYPLVSSHIILRPIKKT